VQVYVLSDASVTIG